MANNDFENPPQNNGIHEEVEKLENIPIDPYLASLRTNERLKIEEEESKFEKNQSIVKAQKESDIQKLSTEARLGAEKAELLGNRKESILDTKRVLYSKESGTTKKGYSFLRKARNILTGLFALGTVGAKASNFEKPLPDSGKTIERKISQKVKKDTATAAIPLYTKSKTFEGGVTPTGFNNSFYENEFGIKESDIATIAKEYGFRTTSALEFQIDLIEYTKQHHPEVLDEVLKKYGETNFSEETGKKGVEGLKDAKLGVRTAFILSKLKNLTPSNHPETGPTPSGGEIFNTDGYQKLIVLFDNSPSMYAHREFLASDLKDNVSNVPVEVVGFSNKADTTMTLESPRAASEVLKSIKIVDQNKELAVNELRNKLQSMEVQVGKTKIVVCTDEALQDVTREKLNDLQKLSAEKNVDLVFSIIINEKSYKLTLEDVEDSFEKMLSEFNRQLEIRKNIIQEAQKTLENSSIKEKKRLEKEIKEAQSESEYFQNLINGNKSLDISSFENSKNKTLVASK